MNKSKNIGLYFGTYNPIHIGHLIIANHLVEFTELDEVWLVITPQNPFKKNKKLLADYHRYQMVEMALEDYDHLHPSRIEFDMPQPNYTSKTLIRLEEKYKDIRFNLIIGEDNLINFKKWKNSDFILDHYNLYVCPRESKSEAPKDLSKHQHIIWTKTPIMEISSTYVRGIVKDGKNYKPLVPKKVWNFIDEMNFYKI